MRKRPKWESVDWVELGARGWDIDETGAGLADPPENLWVEDNAHLRFRVTDEYANPVKNAKISSQRAETCEGERGHAHLDFKTLSLILHGPPEFVERVVGDLRAANVLTPLWTTTIYPSTGTMGATASTWGVVCQ